MQLSERELDVLRLAACGASDRDIADALYIELKTAEHHIANVLCKLHARNRTHAVIIAVADGILTARDIVHCADMGR